MLPVRNRRFLIPLSPLFPLCFFVACMLFFVFVFLCSYFCSWLAIAIQQVFTNCKVFNKFGSTIWYIADYLQAKFERLFQVGRTTCWTRTSLYMGFE